MGNLFDMEREARKKRNLQIREKYGLEPEEKKKEDYSVFKTKYVSKGKSKLKFSVNKNSLFGR